MTKPRAPLTYDNALARIAGLIGWPAMGQSVGQAERTVRDWGDPDVERGCPIEAAELLDIAYQAAGGEGSPMLETFAMRMDAARQVRFASEAEIARATCVLTREGAQAVEALILLSQPGANAQQRVTALRELEEFIAVGKSILPLVATAPPDTS